MLNRYPIIIGLLTGVILPVLLFLLMKLIISWINPEFNKPEAFLGCFIPGVILIRVFFKNTYPEILAKTHLASTVVMVILFFIFKTYYFNLFVL